MRYRHTDYTISGQTITLTGVTTVTNADIRLIVDETAKIVICSSMQKDNVTCSTNVITVPTSVATLNSQHVYTIELDFGEQLGDVAAALDYMESGGLPTIDSIAKQGTNANATLSDVQAQVADVRTQVINNYMVDTLANGVQSMAAIDVVEVSDQATTLSAAPNTLYLCSGRTSSTDLAITLQPLTDGNDTDYRQEYHFLIYPTSGIATVTFEYANAGTAGDEIPDTIHWAFGSTPSFEARDVYEVGILNGLAVYSVYNI